MATNEKSNKQVYGYVEKVTLVEKKCVLSAKLDTGAKTASLNAENIRETEEDGKIFLYFTVSSAQGLIDFKAEYLGKVRIKARAGEFARKKHHFLRRPVVMIRVQLGNEERDIRVNLTNRKRFNYAFLLGRDAINAFDGLVDPAHTFLLPSHKT
ncbi:MAG: RimK/LysX family protein [Legionellaceae bacterium]|nr:RimK/LysX family protein [Legionellaceae bacterium]